MEGENRQDRASSSDQTSESTKIDEVTETEIGSDVDRSDEEADADQKKIDCDDSAKTAATDAVVKTKPSFLQMIKDEFTEQGAHFRAFVQTPRGMFLTGLSLVWVALGILVIIYSDQVFSLIDRLSAWVREQGILGATVLSLLIFIASFPPVIGYLWFIMMAGYIYGWWGIIPAYIGALTGGIGCFLLYRLHFRHWLSDLSRMYLNMKGFERVIASRGWTFVLLVRIAPYPYPVFNALFAGTNTPFTAYALATAVSLVPKMALYVFLGKSMKDLSEIFKGGSRDLTDWLILIGTGLLGLGISIYVFYQTRMAIYEMQNELDSEAEEAREQINSKHEDTNENSKSKPRSDSMMVEEEEDNEECVLDEKFVDVERGERQPLLADAPSKTVSATKGSGTIRLGGEAGYGTANT